MVDKIGFIDVGFRGYRYTWNNKRVGQTNIQERLDMAFANGLWRTSYPTATVYHLIAFNSDHRLVTIDIAHLVQTRPRLFQYEAMWIRDPSAGLLIEHVWNKGTELTSLSHLMSKIKGTKVALMEWNTKVFGHLQSRIRVLKEDIDLLQSSPQTSRNISLEQQAQTTLDEL